jgi:hypothetical protein
MTATYTESEVPGNCTVRVMSFSGQCVLSTTIEEPKEIILLSFSLVAVCARKLNVPRLCLHLVWPRIQRSITDHAHLVLDVQLVITQIRIWTRLHRPYECDLCFDPCDDTDDIENYHDGNEMREFNCRRCQSPTMCLNCRLLSNSYLGGWVCFRCAREEDMVVWTESSSQRARWMGRGPLAMPMSPEEVPQDDW